MLSSLSPRSQLTARSFFMIISSRYRWRIEILRRMGGDAYNIFRNIPSSSNPRSWEIAQFFFVYDFSFSLELVNWNFEIKRRRWYSVHATLRKKRRKLFVICGQWCDQTAQRRKSWERENCSERDRWTLIRDAEGFASLWPLRAIVESLQLVFFAL